MTPRRVIAGLSLLILAAVATLQLEGASLLGAGDSSPAGHVTLDDGQELNLQQPAGVVVLNFWATWCRPCREEAPILSRIHRELGDAGRVVGVAIDGASLDDVTRAARELGMSYPIALSSPSLARRFRVQGVPTTYVIDPHGEIVHSAVGMVDHDRLARAIEAARSP